MSIFNGKLQRRGGLSGKVTDQTPRLQVTFTPDNEAPWASVTPVSRLGGAWVRAGKVFTAAMESTSLIYRFAAAFSRFFTRHGAELSTAPVQQVEATTRAIRTASDAAPTTVHAPDLSADRGVQLGTTAAAEASPGAAGVAKKRIVLECYAAPDAVKRAVAHAGKRIVMARVSEAEGAPGVCTSARDEFLTVYEAAMATAPAVLTSAVSRTFEPEAEAAAGAAPAQIAAAESVEQTAHTVRAATWIEPYWEDGVLVIKQAYRATLTENRLEVE